MTTTEPQGYKFGITRAQIVSPCFGCGLTARAGDTFCGPCKNNGIEGRQWRRRARVALEQAGVSSRQIELKGITPLWNGTIKPELERVLGIPIEDRDSCWDCWEMGECDHCLRCGDKCPLIEDGEANWA